MVDWTLTDLEVAASNGYVTIHLFPDAGAASYQCANRAITDTPQLALLKAIAAQNNVEVKG